MRLTAPMGHPTGMARGTPSLSLASLGRGHLRKASCLLSEDHVLRPQTPDPPRMALLPPPQGAGGATTPGRGQKEENEPHPGGDTLS